MRGSEDRRPDDPIADHADQTGAIRLVMLNGQHAAAERSRRQAQWVSALPDADIVVVTEVGTGQGGKALIASLRRHGYDQIHAPFAADGDYGALLATRVGALEPVPSSEFLPHRAPVADVWIEGRGIRLLGLYAPSRDRGSKRNEAKRAFQLSVIKELPRLVCGFDGPMVVAGDLNIVEPGHRPHYKVFGEWEYDFYRAFGVAGLADSYRALHPGTVEHSWFGRGGNGYRFDYIFTSEDTLAVAACDYLHDARHEGISDHAAMRLVATLRKPGPG